MPMPSLLRHLQEAFSTRSQPSAEPYQCDDPSSLDVTEHLTILPSDTETYHLQLKSGITLTVTLQADGPVELRLLDHATWRNAGTPDARRVAPCRYALPSTESAVVEFSAHTGGDFLLLVWNGSHRTTTNALLWLATRPTVQTPKKQPKPELAGRIWSLFG